ncbi:hypothetical protein L2719_08730 [Shewanella schlegeliana]|uniref:Uncharacterized protein n=1 Tax=Shewanella schlegeliana TaxID=190308 RepID=A0ABS1T1U1_9GAMM|nr:hypothetical protein [Shewanella schlegeliana]MBL4914560.1 hypothetical protein [Shewanella schlegeliana]MCL1109624.1 hypothetical protein [Shewanella schlegeliana]
MLSLSIVDQYHLNIKVEIDAQIKSAKVQVYYFYPAPLSDHSDIFSPTFFYQNLLQKQSLVRAKPISIETIKNDLLLLRQYAYAKAQDNAKKYVTALSNFVIGINQILLKLQPEQLTVVAELIESFQGIHDNESQLTHHKLYLLANHQLIYYFNQALLKSKSQKTKAERAYIDPLLTKINQYADTHNLKLTSRSDDDREKLLRRLHMGRRIINTPYKVRRKKLKGGAVAEQLIFGFAAALAMAFATGVAFATQKAFGNFSTPFFISLVLSYIFKDRIKELGRNYLMEKFFSHFFQHHYRFHANDGTRLIDIKETYYRQQQQQLSKSIIAILKRVNHSERDRLDVAFVHQRSYFSQATNNKHKKFLDELTINLSKSLRLLPKVISPHWYESESQIKQTKVHKVHTIHLVIVLQHNGETHHYHYKLYVSRKGMHRIENKT